MASNDERLRAVETAVQVHSATDVLHHKHVEGELAEIKSEMKSGFAALAERLDEHSDEGKPARNTQPGVVVANQLDNPTTLPGEPHGRWDAPSLPQIAGWAAAIGTIVTTITAALTAGIITGYQATIGSEAPTKPEPIAVEIVAPAPSE